MTASTTITAARNVLPVALAAEVAWLAFLAWLAWNG